MDEIAKPILVKYGGLDADEHLIQGDLFGESVIGATRLYTSVAHYCFFGFVPRGNYRRELVVKVEPIKPGSVDQLYHLLPLIAGQYAMHAFIYNEAFSYIFQQICDALKDMWTGKNGSQVAVDKLVDALTQQARINAEVQAQLVNGLVKANDNLASLQAKLIDTLPALAGATRPHAVHLVAPVSVSCSTVNQFANTERPVLITESEAKLIRGEGEKVVGAAREYTVNRITELDITNGHCKLDVQNLGEVIGNIADPVLKTPENVYTQALDKHTTLRVTAKAVETNGIIQKLVISDGR